MGIEAIKRAVDCCLKEGAIHFNLIGGEPTMNDKLFDVIDYIHAKGALMSLATNGSLFSPEYVRKLKAHGLDLVLASMDYFDAGRQNELRGDGFFEGAMAAVENCLKEGLPVYVSSVVTRNKEGRESFYKLADFCTKKNILLHVNLPALIGQWKGREDLFLTEEDKKEARELYRRKGVSCCEMSSYFEFACRSGHEKIHITAYGDVLPCTFIPISFGNILNEDLSVIRRRILDFPLFKVPHEMCIPSTDSDYFKFYKDQISTAPLLPISYAAVKWS
jgi:MoaA/NifB/PqqE/SkfB family radical SAM enzyme